MSEPVTCHRVGRQEGGKRLDRFLMERIPGLSRARIQRSIRERVSLSWDVRARPATLVRPGGEVRIGWVPLAEEPLSIELPILARGPGWLAVDKPPGIPVHPVNRVRENSLIRMLRRQEGREDLRLAHRLDRETSGVLIVAEDPATARSLSVGFARGTVHKEYLAWVEGEIAGDRGRIDFPIGDAVGSRVFVRRAAGVGQPASTRWAVEWREAGRTLLRLEPRTGRRHQIRVHLEAIGHPVAGDILYGRPDADYLDLVRGTRDARREAGAPSRQLLHCARIAFRDPAGVLEIDVCSPLPDDMARDGSSEQTQAP